MRLSALALRLSVLGRSLFTSLTIAACATLATAQDYPSPPAVAPSEPMGLVASFEDEQTMLDEARVRDLIEQYMKDHAAHAAATPPAPAPGAMSTKWNYGLEAESADKEFRVHVGGRVQLDGTWYDADDAIQFGPGGLGEFQDAVNFRRARLRVDGTMYYTIDWAAEFDFSNTVDDEPTNPPANGDIVVVPAVTDLWFTFTQLPYIGNLRIGSQKEGIGMEHLTSSRFLDFMERSFMQDAFFGPFNNGFTPGIQAMNWHESERMTWQAGVFKNANNIFGYGVGDGEYAATARVTALPWYCNEGRSLLHFGLSGSHRDTDNDSIRIRSRASLRSGPPGPWNPVLADTGTFFADSQDLVGAECAGVLGPFNWQAEYCATWIDDAVAGNIDRGTYMAQGCYFQGLYFLTGEHRLYNRKTGVFDRVKPYENFFLVDTCDGGCGHGLGAWQIGLRYSWLDLRDSGIDGGIIQDVTLGLNWYLNANSKIQFNTVWCEREAPNNGATGEFLGFGTRLAFDF